MNTDFSHTEKELLIQLSQGYEPAFRRIYDHYSAGLYRVANRYLQSDALAEDTVQEIFLTIWSRRTEVREIEFFRYYLFTMTRNHCLKHLKAKAQDSSTHQEFIERAELNEDSFADAYGELLNGAVQRLPLRQKQIFEMAKLQGMSHEMIAASLNLSLSTVNNHITAALKTLRKYLRHSTIVWLAWLGSGFH